MENRREIGKVKNKDTRKTLRKTNRLRSRKTINTVVASLWLGKVIDCQPHSSRKLLRDECDSRSPQERRCRHNRLCQVVRLRDTSSPRRPSHPPSARELVKRDGPFNTRTAEGTTESGLSSSAGTHDERVRVRRGGLIAAARIPHINVVVEGPLLVHTCRTHSSSTQRRGRLLS